MITQIIHTAVNLPILFVYGGYELYLFVGCMMHMLYRVAYLYFYADNQMAKITKVKHRPWRSFMQESIRGTVIIRAFN